MIPQNTKQLLQFFVSAARPKEVGAHYYGGPRSGEAAAVSGSEPGKVAAPGVVGEAVLMAGLLCPLGGDSSCTALKALILVSDGERGG
jgi:hypothetical protein